MAKYPCKFDTPHVGLEWLEYYGEHKVYHPGFDLNKGQGNDDYGNLVVAPIKGEIEYVSPEPTIWNNQNGGLGWFVISYHPAYGIWFRYAHLSKVGVEKGQSIKEGETIGSVGKSGTTSAHLHFEGWNKAGWEVQRKHWRRYAYYPSNKSKQWVQEHYFNPLAFIEDLMEVPAWETEAREWAVENKISNGDRPHDKATRVEIWKTFKNYHENLTK